MRARWNSISALSVSRISVMPIILFLLTAGFALWGQTDDISLSGEWQISFGETRQGSSEPVVLPTMTGPLNEEGEPHIWISNTFMVSGTATDPLYVELGKIEAAVRVYLNDVFIGDGGQFPPGTYFSGGRYYRYLLPEGVLNTSGTNTIKIHLYNDAGDLQLGDISVRRIPHTDTFPYLVEFLNVHLFLAFSLLSGFIGLFFLLQYIFRQNERTNLYFALANFALFLYFLEMGLGLPSVPFVGFKLVAKSVMPLFFAFLTLFFLEYLDIMNRRGLKRLILAAGILFFALFYIFARTTVEVMLFFTLSLLPGAIDLILMAVASGLGIVRGNRRARLMAIGVAIGIGAALHDFYYQFSGGEPLVWLQGIGIFLFDVSMFISLALRNIQMQRRLEIYSAEIEEQREALSKYVENIENVSATVRGSTDRLNEDIQAATGSFKKLSKNTDGITRDTQDQFTVVQEIDTTTRELIDSLEGTYKRLDSQNREIHETSATIEQMLGNLEEVTVNLKETSDFTLNLERITERGQQAVVASTRAIQEVKETSRSIYEVIDAVNNLAEQTNLLSINAGIEAAHAGSAGSGFAVVASEIKKLAEASSKRAQEVYAHIESITARIDEGVEVNDQVRKLLEEINNNTARASAQIRAIYDKTTEQRSASHTIKTSLEALQDSSREIKNQTDRQNIRGKSIEEHLERLLSSSRHVLENIETIGSENYAILRRVDSIRDLSDESTVAMNKLSGLIIATRQAEANA